jgi:peptidoglycan/LPS O-acetylase OafA/YrhL
MATGNRRSPLQGLLSDRFNPRRNLFDLLRLTLALLVVVDHGIVMRTGGHHTWGRSAIGDLAVDGFFILSGLLITRSYLSLSSFWRFAWHRLLRIMPGFLVCLVVTALVVAPVAALLTGRSVTSVFTEEPSALRYIWGNAGLLITQYEIAGLLPENPNPLVVNGALWTLVFEAACYALVGALGALALLRRARWSVPVVAVVVWCLTLAQEAGVEVLVGDDTLRLLLAFLIGATMWLYADRVPMRSWLAVVAALVLLISIASLENYRLLGVVPAAYLLIWVGTCLPWSFSLRQDLSYGVYIYHWPVLQLLAATALVTVPVPVFLLVGGAITGMVAFASWHLVEHPALLQKNRSLPRLLGRGGPDRGTPAAARRAGSEVATTSAR